MPDIKNAAAAAPVKKVPFAVSEAYKNIRTNLVSILARQGNKVIAVSSPNASEGKSTTAINTAISLSQLNKKVILIDADAHRPSLHSKLRLDNKNGLMDVINGITDIDGTVKKYNTYLDILTVGNIPQNPTEVFDSVGFDGFLTAAKEKYDYVIIDTPPVNLLSDASVISQKCDGLVLVVRAGITTHSMLKRSLSALKMLNINIIGIISMRNTDVSFTASSFKIPVSRRTNKIIKP